MSKKTHQWTTFQKGKMKVQACTCCGQMKFASNAEEICTGTDLISSPIVQAGYQLSVHLPVSARLVA
jgi:hypothetical protein